LAVAISAFALVGAVNAQSQIAGEDGIAASPKVRAQLNERKARLQTTTVAVPSMACPKCKDAWVAQLDTNSKGSGARTLMGQTTKLVAQHLCSGCATTITVAGQGKAKHDVAAHKCDSCGSANLACCGTAKGSETTTKGMEKESVEIAPIK
jgi:hypothetical protein